MFGLVVLFATSTASADVWRQIGGDWVTGTGTQVVVPVPVEMRVVYPYGYVAASPFMTRFIVRIGPGSLQRGCTLATNDTGDVVATGVVSSQMNLRPTSLTSQEQSPSMPGWQNNIFSVNGGFGAPVQAITVAFKRGFENATQCYFQLMYQGGEQAADPRMARAAAAPSQSREITLQSAQAEAAPAENAVKHVEVKAGGL